MSRCIFQHITRRAAKEHTQVLMHVLGYLAQWQRELEHLTSVDFHVFILSRGESLDREGSAGEGTSWHCSSLSLALEVFSANNINCQQSFTLEKMYYFCICI